MKEIILYFKLQYKLLFALLLFLAIPLLILLNSKLNVPYLSYFFLMILAALKFIIFKKRSTHKSIKFKAKLSLEKEMKRSPSSTQVVKRSLEYIAAQDAAIILVGAILIFISLIYGGF